MPVEACFLEAKVSENSKTMKLGFFGHAMQLGGILVPQSPVPSAVKAWHPNHWTARELPCFPYKINTRPAIEYEFLLSYFTTTLTTYPQYEMTWFILFLNLGLYQALIPQDGESLHGCTKGCPNMPGMTGISFRLTHWKRCLSVICYL